MSSCPLPAIGVVQEAFIGATEMSNKLLDSTDELEVTEPDHDKIRMVRYAILICTPFFYALPCIWAKFCRTGKKCLKCHKLTLTLRVAQPKRLVW